MRTLTPETAQAFASWQMDLWREDPNMLANQKEGLPDDIDCCWVGERQLFDAFLNEFNLAISPPTPT